LSRLSAAGLESAVLEQLPGLDDSPAAEMQSFGQFSTGTDGQYSTGANNLSPFPATTNPTH
jgi:hypothetical protein